MRKRSLRLLCGVIMLVAVHTVSARLFSDPIVLNIESGPRLIENIEMLAYDTLWLGVSNADYRILVNGTVLVAGQGTGTVAWCPTNTGTYVLTYQTFVDKLKVGEDMSATFELVGKNLANAEVSFPSEEVIFDGTVQCPKVKVTYQSEILVEGTDYVTEYDNNINPGVATVIIRGQGRFTDVLEKNFIIRPAGICSLDIESGIRRAQPVEKLNFDYSWCGDMNENTRMQIRVNNAILANSTGIGCQEWKPGAGGKYVVTYRTYVDDYLQSDRTLTALFGVPGGDFSLWNVDVEMEYTTCQYDGSPKTPNVTVSTDLGMLIRDQDYQVTYQNNVDPGTATVLIRGIGDYAGELARTFSIRSGLLIRDVLAQQRYPWNGKVDVSFRLFGEENTGYRVGLIVKDEEGETNLPVQTVWMNEGLWTNRLFTLKPGLHRIVWNAGVDIPHDTVLNRVSVQVSAEEMPEVALTFNPNGGTFSDENMLEAYPATGVTNCLFLVRAGSSFGSLPVVSLAGKRFLGWTREGEATNCVSATDVVPEQALTLTAQWGDIVPPHVENLFLYWPLDGTVRDASGHGVSMVTAKGNLGWTSNRYGRSGVALYCDGASEFGFSGSHGGVSNTFTIAFWARTDSTLSSIGSERNTGNYGIIELSYPYAVWPAIGGVTGDAGVGIAIGANGVAVVEHDGDYFPATLMYAATIGSEWNHFCVTVEDNGAPKLYLNGVLVRTGLKSDKLKYILGDNRLGGGSYGHFTGALSDFLLYRTALTEDDVAELYRRFK